MKQHNKTCRFLGHCLLAAFVLWTLAVRFVDVQAIGPGGSAVGFAAINEPVHRLIGVHMFLYTLTDWLGLVPIAFGFGFAVLGLIQWIRRKQLLLVDRSLLVLGVFYLIAAAAYALFEVLAVNYRPVELHGVLEASYPSSTTMLTMFVIPTALMQLRSRLRNRTIRQWVSAAMIGFLLFMVIGRLLSGVHWVTDIVGGALLSGGLVLLYSSFTA